MLSVLTLTAKAQEFSRIPRAWKWINEKEVLFSYDGTFADSAAFVVDARTGKQRTGVSAPAKYASYPVQPERAVKRQITSNINFIFSLL